MQLASPLQLLRPEKGENPGGRDLEEYLRYPLEQVIAMKLTKTGEKSPNFRSTNRPCTLLSIFIIQRDLDQDLVLPAPVPVAVPSFAEVMVMAQVMVDPGHLHLPAYSAMSSSTRPSDLQQVRLILCPLTVIRALLNIHHKFMAITLPRSSTHPCTFLTPTRLINMIKLMVMALTLLRLYIHLCMFLKHTRLINRIKLMVMALIQHKLSIHLCIFLMPTRLIKMFKLMVMEITLHKLSIHLCIFFTAIRFLTPLRLIKPKPHTQRRNEPGVHNSKHRQDWANTSKA